MQTLNWIDALSVDSIKLLVAELEKRKKNEIGRTRNDKKRTRNDKKRTWDENWKNKE